MKPYFEEDGIVIYHGDCREILPQLELPADLVFTSPPYASQRDYGRPIEDWDALMIGAFVGLVCKPDTQILINLGQVHENGNYVDYWELFFQWMTRRGWRKFGRYVWDQGDGLPGEWAGRFAPSHEFVFHFNKKARAVNKTLKSKRAGEISHGGGLRHPDGRIAEFNHVGRVQPEFKIGDSVIRIYREMARNGYEAEHPAIFPLELPEFIIKAMTQPAELVIEPFCGSGTTLLAAKNLGRRAIGIEIEEKYCEIAAKRLSQKVLNFTPSPAETDHRGQGPLEGLGAGAEKLSEESEV